MTTLVAEPSTPPTPPQAALAARGWQALVLSALAWLALLGAGLGVGGGLVSQTLATQLAFTLQPMSRPVGSGSTLRGAGQPQAMAAALAEATLAAPCGDAGTGLPAQGEPRMRAPWADVAPLRVMAAAPVPEWPRAHPSRAPPVQA